MRTAGYSSLEMLSSGKSNSLMRLKMFLQEQKKAGEDGAGSSTMASKCPNVSGMF